MRRGHFNGRRFLVQLLLGINVLIWGAYVAWADDQCKAAERKPAEYVAESFQSDGKSIPVWRFNPKAAGKHPAVLLLHGADGGVGVEKLYCGLAKRVAEKGYVVFIVHYLDATKPEGPANISELVKRAVRGEATEEEKPFVERYFDVWTSCVSDAVRYVRNQPRVDGERVGIVGLSLGGFVGLSCAAQKELHVAAVVSGFGGLPKERREAVQWLPPTLVIHGDEDEVVPIQHAIALRKLGRERKLPIEVKIYEGVGHVFQLEDGKFHWLSLVDAEKRMTEHLEKHLKPAMGRAEVVSGKTK